MSFESVILLAALLSLCVGFAYRQTLGGRIFLILGGAGLLGVAGADWLIIGCGVFILVAIGVLNAVRAERLKVAAPLPEPTAFPRQFPAHVADELRKLAELREAKILHRGRVPATKGTPSPIALSARKSPDRLRRDHGSAHLCRGRDDSFASGARGRTPAMLT